MTPVRVCVKRARKPSSVKKVLVGAPSLAIAVPLLLILLFSASAPVASTAAYGEPVSFTGVGLEKGSSPEAATPSVLVSFMEFTRTEMTDSKGRITGTLILADMSGAQLGAFHVAGDYEKNSNDDLRVIVSGSTVNGQVKLGLSTSPPAGTVLPLSFNANGVLTVDGVSGLDNGTCQIIGSITGGP
ncbi:MAG: hypothetical protein ACE5PO_07695 [Candidatus Bathyarchaeia archaeon]